MAFQSSHCFSTADTINFNRKQFLAVQAFSICNISIILLRWEHLSTYWSKQEFNLYFNVFSLRIFICVCSFLDVWKLQTFNDFYNIIWCNACTGIPPNELWPHLKLGLHCLKDICIISLLANNMKSLIAILQQVNCY